MAVQGGTEVAGNGVPFQRTRRITGYLVGDLERFNNAKRCEERERLRHGVKERIMTEITCCPCTAPSAEVPVLGLKLLPDKSAPGKARNGSQGASGSGIDYSLHEQWTGRHWIDGKKIYQKTIDFGAVNGGDKNVALNIANLDR